MGWFDEQIRQRMKNDQDVFEDSMINMVSAVLGKKAARDLDDSRVITKAAIDEIIKYYGFKPQESTFNDLGETLDLQNILGPYSIMYREIELSEGWLEEAYGPMIGRFKEDGRVIALLPRAFSGYYYEDYRTGKRVIVTKKVAESLERDALCFYKPLPRKALGIGDLIAYLKGTIDAADIVAYVAIDALVVAIGLMIAPLVELISGYILDRGSVPMLVATALFLVSLGLAKLLIEACTEMVKERIEIKTGISVEAAVMNRVLSLPARFFRKYTAGELSARINSVNNLCDLIINNAVLVPITTLLSLVYIVQIRDFAPGLAAPAILISLASLLFTSFIIVLQARLNHKLMQYQAKEDGITYALINGVQKIRLSGSEKRAFAKWAGYYNKCADVLYSPPFILRINKTVNMAIGIIGMLALYVAAVKTGVSTAEYMAFNTAYGLFTGAIAGITTLAVSTANIGPILNMAEPILKEVPEANEGKIVINKLNGNIELSNIHFKYEEDGPDILKGINCKIKSGEYVAIVGKTGSGKSTLLRLLLGFETPTKGAIYYDGKDISRVDLSSLRRKIGTVTQNGSLFQGDIFSNIVITNPFMTLDDAWEAAEIAGIADDIRQMPMGMHTIISEGQGGISGGQKQRLMIARAAAPKPKILMLDEATSALDNITQKKVSDSLDKLDCTRIVIAHRLSTIKNCDRILVIDDGVIVEQGTYDDLLAKGGYFADLVKRQQL